MFVNCVSYKSGRNGKNKDVLFSFTAAEKSPVSPVNVNSNDFDNKVKKITERKMRLVQLTGSTNQFLLLLSSSNQVEWTDKAISLINIFTFDGNSFADAGTINLDGVAIESIDFDDLDTT